MIRLIRAELYRYAHEWFVRAAAVLCILFALWCGSSAYPPFLTPFVMTTGVSVIISAALMLHGISEKNSDTVRLSVTVGLTKGRIFLAKLITAAGFALLLWGLALGAYFAAVQNKDLSYIPREQLCLFLLDSCLTQILWAVLTVLFSLLFQAKGIGEALFSGLLIFLLLFSVLAEKKLEKEMCLHEEVTETIVTKEEAAQVPADGVHIKYKRVHAEDGSIVIKRIETNISLELSPYAAQGALRTAYVVLSYCFPGGKLLWYGQYERYFSACAAGATPDGIYLYEPAPDIRLFPLWSGLWVLGLSAAGFLLFRRKQLR